MFWECIVLATGPPGKFPQLLFMQDFPNGAVGIFKEKEKSMSNKFGKVWITCLFFLLWDSESFYWCRSLQFCPSISHIFWITKLDSGDTLVNISLWTQMFIGLHSRLFWGSGVLICLPSRCGNSRDVGTQCAQMSLNLFGTCSVLFLPEPLGGTGSGRVPWECPELEWWHSSGFLAEH